jgi:hypothetical protein
VAAAAHAAANEAVPSAAVDAANARAPAAAAARRARPSTLPDNTTGPTVAVLQAEDDARMQAALPGLPAVAPSATASPRIAAEEAS